VEELSVVVPVCNEAENVLPLIQEIRTQLNGLASYELIFVDDGSDDGTGERLASVDIPNLRVIRHRERCGQSTAIRTGVWAARADWVVTLDGDGQNDPADIPVLLAAKGDAGDEPLLVTGYRRERRDSLMKRISSRVANAVRGRLLGDRTPDTGCGLKLFRRDAYLALPYFDHMHRFLPALFLRAGGRVLSVDVRHRPRRHGRTKYGVHNRLWVGIIDLLGVMWLMARVRRPESEELERAR
jgi:dolichol-phosphate mannosyltransferase